MVLLRVILLCHGENLLSNLVTFKETTLLYDALGILIEILESTGISRNTFNSLHFDIKNY
jgi:hypothetical protein